MWPTSSADVLPHGHEGQDAIDQVCRGVRHSSSIATRTNSRKSMRENSALQVRAKLLLDIFGKAAFVMLVRVGKKAREVLARDAVERRLLGTTGDISGCEGAKGLRSVARANGLLRDFRGLRAHLSAPDTFLGTAQKGGPGYP